MYIMSTGEKVLQVEELRYLKVVTWFAEILGSKIDDPYI
jgi:hypothetical protein